MNHKKVQRLSNEEGLQQPRRQKQRKRHYHHDSSIIRHRSTYPNHVWSIGFVHDKLSDGRPYKMLTVLDENTRQALTVEVRTRMTAGDALQILYGLVLRYGKPGHLRIDDGPEFTTEAFRTWLQRVGMEPIGIYPGSPWEN